ncbi:MAG TPA: hypothetical protein PLG47_06520 [Candidatus Dojkabacteria bacterium]|nr:hypothetical protein [Candidatus Dojkabacteria bacterium]
MNQNIRFQTLNQEVSVFKLDVSKPQPFNFYKSYTVTKDNKTVQLWACEIGNITVDVVDGDYIIIGKKVIYLDGEVKYVDYVQPVNKDALVRLIQAYDELQEEYVDIFLVFNEEINYDREPMPEEIQAIDAEVEELLKNWNVLEEDED